MLCAMYFYLFYKKKVGIKFHRFQFFYLVGIQLFLLPIIAAQTFYLNKGTTYYYFLKLLVQKLFGLIYISEHKSFLKLKFRK